MLAHKFVADLREVVRLVRLNEWFRIAQNLQYTRFTKILPSTTLKSRYIHLLETAVIKDYGQDGGGMMFDDQTTGEHTFTNHVFKSGMKWSEFKFKDLDASGIMGGEGIQLVTAWTQQVTALAAYFPQKLAIAALMNAESTSMTLDGKKHRLLCYDGEPLFSKTHPYNYKKTSRGYFSNLFSGAPTTTELGFKPIGGPFVRNAGTGEWEYSAGASMSAEDAFSNLWDVVIQVLAMKMADGVTPRYLSPGTIIAGSRLSKMLSLILDSKFIAMHAGSGSTGGGTADITGSIKRLGVKEPIILPELIGNSARGDWDWYLECEDNVATAEIGSINVGINEPWQQKMFTSGSGQQGVNLELAIENAIVSTGQMRGFVGVGLPQYIFKNKAPRA